MRTLLSASLVALAVSTGVADDPKPATDSKGPAKKAKPGVSLQVGDPAPALKASKWLQGQAVKKFERGQIYVVEFWATWCGWCIIMMPHTAELQTQYKNKGVTFIYYSAKDPQNTEEQVAAFVKRRGPKLRSTFAYGDDRTTYDAWVTAAGRSGLPCVFVVDRVGRIAYIGHPMFLGVVLPRVVAGATPRAISAEAARIWEEFGAVSKALAGPNPRVGLEALAEFEKKYPALADTPPLVRAKLSYLPKVGKPDQAKKVAEAVVARAIEQHNPSSLMQVAALLRLGDGKKSKELLAVAVKAAEAAVRVAGDRDARALIDLASTYFAAGDKARAREFGKKAVKAAAAESAELKQYVEQQAKTFEAKKEDKK
jgi:thiol-disulfide isomerase/thioredoxin